MSKRTKVEASSVSGSSSPKSPTPSATLVSDVYDCLMGVGPTRRAHLLSILVKEASESTLKNIAAEAVKLGAVIHTSNRFLKASPSILNDCFSFLGHRALKACEIVCTRWRYLVHDGGVVGWPSLIARTPTADKMRKLAIPRLIAPDSIRLPVRMVRIDIKGKDDKDNKDKLEIALDPDSEWASRLPNVEAVRFSQLGTYDILAFQYTPLAKSVRRIVIERETPQFSFNWLLPTFPQLLDLTMPMIAAHALTHTATKGEISKHLGRLRSLTLTLTNLGVSYVGPITSLVPFLKRIERLDLCNSGYQSRHAPYQQQSEDKLVTALAQLTTLTELRMPPFWRDRDDSGVAKLSALTNLKSLALYQKKEELGDGDDLPVLCATLGWIGSLTKLEELTLFGKINKIHIPPLFQLQNLRGLVLDRARFETRQDKEEGPLELLLTGMKDEHKLPLLSTISIDWTLPTHPESEEGMELYRQEYELHQEGKRDARSTQLDFDVLYRLERDCKVAVTHLSEMDKEDLEAYLDDVKYKYLRDQMEDHDD